MSTMDTRKYAVVIERAKRNYSAYVPDLPGCVATGNTPEETQRNIAAAIEFHLRGMAADGDPVPAEPSSRVAVVSVPFDPSVWKASPRPASRRKAYAADASSSPKIVAKPRRSREA